MKKQYLFGILLLTFSFLLSFTPVNLAQNSTQIRNIAEQLEKEGIEQLQIGQIQNTIASWQKALQLYRQIQERGQEARVLENLGELYLQIKEYARAIEVLEPGLIIVQQLGDREAESEILLKLATAYRQVKDEQKATIYYQKFLVTARQLNNIEGQITALGNLGTIYLNREKYTEAIDVFAEAVNLSKKINARQKEALGYNSIGTAYYLLGNCEYAQAFYELSGEVAREIKDLEQQVSALQNRGNAAYCLGKFQVALDSYQQGFKIAQQLKNESQQGELIGNIGLVYVHLGKYDRAIEYLQQDLATAKKLGKKKVEGQALGSLGDAYYYQENYQQALQYYQQSLAIAQEVNYTRGVGLILTNIGATLYKLRQLPEAEKKLRESIQILSSLRETAARKDEDKISLFERESRSYRILQAVLIAQNKPELALEIAEAGRARSYAELLTKKVGKAQNNPRITLTEIKNIAAKLKATLVEYSPIYDKDENKEKEAILYIWVVQPNGKITFKQVELSKNPLPLRKRIENTREGFGLRGRNNKQQEEKINKEKDKNLQDLYQLLIQPIAETLPTKAEERVIFIPQEELFMIPFPALQNEQGIYLIEKHTIVTSPSIQILDLSQKITVKNSRKKALIVGNPIMPKIIEEANKPPVQLEQLENSEKEAKAIAKILNTQAIVGEKATKNYVREKMKQAGIIHLATHGLLDVSANGLINQEYAGYRGDGGVLALAPTANDNGLLTVEEIINLPLSAELVVLSACDTGRGKITGDGVLGLSRSFIAAGAKSAIVSLWSIPDESTAQLMEEFYRLLEQKNDKATALRQAMLKTMKDNPYPVNWAAFTLIGALD